jgi:hypothetical protein
MMRFLHFCTAVVVAILVIGINTPPALADSFTAVASVTNAGCSSSDTLNEPGAIALTCGSPGPAYATYSANLGMSSGEISYFGTTSQGGMIGAGVDIAGEIMAPGDSGSSIITFEFEGSESQAAAVGCDLTFEGQTTNCTVLAPFGPPGIEDLEFVVQNGQAYSYDLGLTVGQYLIDAPSQATFQYSLPFVASEPVPEPVSLVLVLSGFVPLAFRLKHLR